MNHLAPQDWSFPVPIAYGPGRLREMADHCRRAGMIRPLIVTDRGSASLPFLDDLRGYLAAGGLESALFSGISPNPRDTEIAAGRAQYRAGGHDGIIAIGGGSGMDGGKAIALTAANEVDLWAFEFEQGSPDVAGFPPLITIPTTAGTGAETESTAMITDTGKAMKWCVWHPALKPSLALLDPEITLGLPPHLTAWTGADALVHAIEAYSVPGFHPLCDGLALEALRLIARWLPVAVAEPDNLEALQRARAGGPDRAHGAGGGAGRYLLRRVSRMGLRRSGPDRHSEDPGRDRRAGRWRIPPRPESVAGQCRGHQSARRERVRGGNDPPRGVENGPLIPRHPVVSWEPARSGARYPATNGAE